MNSLNRFLVIFIKLFPPFLTYSMFKNNPESKNFQKSTANIRIAFQQLGPAFIKLGQMLSARPDIMGADLSDELRKLLDQEQAIPFSIVQDLIENECKIPISKIFKNIDKDPLATASIAQVHKAILLDGKTVAVKIQRPEIENTIKNDLSVFKKVSVFLDSIIRSKGLRLQYVYKEFSDWIMNELDFNIEGRRTDKFGENMKDVEGIIIPEIYWQHTTAKVLVMSYIEGPTLNHILDAIKEQKVSSIYDVKLKIKIDPDLLIERIVAAVTKQVLVDKFFHGDLHPANIIVQKQNKIAFVDFGIVGALNAEEHTQILLTMLALTDEDPQALLKIITSLISEPLTPGQMGLLHQEISDELHKLHEDSGGKVGLNHFVSLLLSLSQKYNLLWSAGFLLAAKSIAQIDSISQKIGIKKPLVEIIKPYVENSITHTLSSNLSKENIYKSLINLVEAGRKLPQTLTDLEQVISNNSTTKIQALYDQQNSKPSGQNLSISQLALIILAPILGFVFIYQPLSKALLIGFILLLLLVIIGILFRNEGR